MNFHTTISGEFTIYRLPSPETAIPVLTTKNLITDYGLADVKNALWANCFTKVVAGSGTTLPQITDTVLESYIIGSSTISNIIPSGTVNLADLTSLSRAWNITNNTGSAITINEIGTTRAATLNSSAQLFSRAVLPQSIVVQNGETIAVLYKLDIAIPGSATSSFSLVNTTFPANSAGIITRPIATILTSGITDGGNTSGVFEPFIMKTNTTIQLYNLSAFPEAYHTKRSIYLSNPSVITNFISVGGTIATVTSPSVNLRPSAVITNHGPFAQSTSVILPINVTSSVLAFSVHGNLFSQDDSLKQNSGLWCVFNEPYTIPADHYFKVSFNQSWGRA